MKTHAPARPVPQPETSESSQGSFLQAWDRFWFAPSSPTTLGLIRVCCGVVTLYVHLAYTFGLLSYVGTHGWVDSEVIRWLRNDVKFYQVPDTWRLPSEDDVVARGHKVWSVYYHLQDPAAIYAVHGAILVAIALFTVGLWTRVTSVLTWIGAMCYLQRIPTLLFGMDTMMNLLLFYLMIGPSGAALSLDRWLERRRYRARIGRDLPLPRLSSATFATRLMQIHFCFIYIASGLSKLQGAAWWNGTALWGTIANTYFAPTNQGWYLQLLIWLSQHRVIWEFVTSGGVAFTLVLEIGLPFLIWNRRLRPYLVCGAVLLHTGIGMTMGLVTFGLMMLCLVMSFVPPEAVESVLGRLGNWWRDRAPVSGPSRLAGAETVLAGGRR